MSGGGWLPRITEVRVRTMRRSLLVSGADPPLGQTPPASTHAARQASKAAAQAANRNRLGAWALPDLQITIINAGPRRLHPDPTRDYQPTGVPKGPTRK